MEIIIQAKNIINIIGPLAVLALAILTAWGILKWGKRLGSAFKDMAESPASFVFMIIVIALFLFIYFEYVNPLFNK